MEAIIFTSGKANGDPGPAAIGVYITDADGQILTEVTEEIGNSTDIYAAYHAVYRGLQTVLEMYHSNTLEKRFEIRIESKVVKEQLNNEKPVHEPALVPMFMEIHNLRVSHFPDLTLIHIGRKKNKEANRLVKEALDGK